MARIKDKLEQLGRAIKPLTISSRDGSQEVEILYQRPTVMRDRTLREAMKAQFDQAVAVFNKVDETGMCPRDKFVKEFKALGKTKIAEFVVSNELAGVQADALREMGADPLPADASEEEQAARFEAFRPYFDECLKARKESYESYDIDSLCDIAVNQYVEKEAQKTATALYRLRLVKDSLIEPDPDSVDKSKYVPVFDTVEEIEEFLSPETLDDISDLIIEEVRKAREIPLKSV